MVEALPLRPGMRVLEIGCGPGVAAIEVAHRVGPDGHVLAVDRSAKAIAQLERSAADLIAARRLTALTTPIEELELPAGTPPFDLAFAVRVGALDGRHPKLEVLALAKIRAALVPGGQLLIDGGDPLRAVALEPPTPEDAPSATGRGSSRRAGR